VLEDSSGGAREVTGADLCAVLQDERSLRLVVLNSCEGARGSQVDPFSAVASSLFQCGVPAVIGMQFEITDDAAKTFAGRHGTRGAGVRASSASDEAENGDRPQCCVGGKAEVLGCGVHLGTSSRS
jgi:hypothetical protein